MSSRSISLLALALFALASEATLAQLPLPVGTQFRVNSYTPGGQSAPSLAMDGAGNFVVAWTSQYQDGGGLSDYGVFARRFNSSGGGLGAEFMVNVYTVGMQSLPIVDVNGSGAFVIAWRSIGQDGAGYGVFARRYTAAGVAQGGELQVSASTVFNETLPAVGVDSDGDFVIAWTSERDGSAYGLFGRRFNSVGTPQATEFQVNSYTPAFQGDADLAMEADGDFAITWLDNRTGDLDVYAQRYASNGAPLATNFLVNTYVTELQRDPSIAVDAGSNLVVVWASYEQDGSSDGIFGRRFNSFGTPIGSEFQVNKYETESQERPDVSADLDGDFVVVWESEGQDAPGDGIFARRIRADGSTQGPDLQVNIVGAGNQNRPTVAGDGDGDFVIAWFDATGASDVIAQRFDVPALLDVDGNGLFEPLADGLLILRFGFGFSGATLITGAVGAGCTRCDAPSIVAYLQTML